MITRRDAMKLATAGFLIPSAHVFAETGTPVASPAATPVATQPTRGSWPMTGGNPARSGVFPGPIPSLEHPVIVRWRFEPENDWLSWDAPVTADGIVYLKGDRNLYAINVDSGLEYWRFETEGVLSVSVANGVVYATSAQGAIHAIDAASGLEIWRQSQQIGAGTPAASSSRYKWPTPVQDALIVSREEAIEALDPATGAPLWVFPAYAWQAPPVDTGRQLVLGSHEGGLSAVDLSSGTEQWRNTSVFGSLAIVDSMVIAVGEPFFSGLELESGLELWRYTLPDFVAAFSIAGSHLLLVTYTENEFGGIRGEIQAIDIATGGLLWVYSLGDNADGDWNIQMRVVQNQLFVQTREPDNLLISIDLHTGLKTWEYRGYIVSVDPIAVDRMLYFVYDGELFAVGNLLDPVLISDVTLRAAPAESGLERGTASAGDAIDHIGARSESNGDPWVEISVGGVSGWVPTSAIDPTTLPPEGDVWVLFDPAWLGN